MKRKKNDELEELKQKELGERVQAAAYDNVRKRLARLSAELETECRLKYEAYYFILAHGLGQQFKEYCNSCSDGMLKELTDYAVGIELRYISDGKGGKP